MSDRAVLTPVATARSRAAIEDANTTGAANQITLPAGHYVLTLGETPGFTDTAGIVLNGARTSPLHWSTPLAVAVVVEVATGSAL